jgi:hypothetical protein
MSVLYVKIEHYNNKKTNKKSNNKKATKNPR